MLLVDDDPLIKTLVIRLLAKLPNLEISYVGHTGDLSDRIDDVRPSLILLDYELPTRQGLDVLEELLEDPDTADIPVILLSVHDDPEIKANCLNRGAADYVVKFPHRREFVARIEAQLEKAERERATKAELKQLRRRAAGAVPSGPLFAGRYRIDSVLGTGSFATVYRAWHEGLAAAVAVKVLKPELVAEDNARAYFRVEGPAAFRVNHPNAVAVYDAGLAAGGQPFVVMEIIEGSTLSDLVAQQGTPSIGRAAQWLAHTADALAAAHAVGVLHRDIKPSNLMVSTLNDALKVVDFGLAQVTDWRDLEPDMIVGTPAYMSPERVSRHAETGKSDVYALGAVAYELFSGRKALGGRGDTPVALANRHLDEIPTTLRRLAPDVPADVALAVMSALSKSQDERPSAAEFADAMRTSR